MANKHGRIPIIHFERVKKLLYMILEREGNPSQNCDTTLLPLTKKDLIAAELSYADTKKLIDNKIIKKISYGKYQLVGIEELKDYISSVNMKLPIEHHELDNSYKQILNLAKEQQYEKLFELLFQLIEKHPNEDVVKDAKIFLRLLLFIEPLPIEYGKLYNNILKDEAQKKNISEAAPVNMIKDSIIQGKLSYAKNKVESIKERTIIDEILLSLLIQAKEGESRNIKKIEKLINDKSSLRVADFLQSRIDNGYCLSQLEKSIYQVANALKISAQTAIFPKEPGTSKNIIEALEEYDFKRALNLLRLSFKQKEKKPSGPLYLLLVEMDELKKKTTEFRIINDALIRTDVVTARERLELFLNSINASNYYKFLDILLYICQEEETNCENVRVVLIQIIRNRFNPKVKEYLEKFIDYHHAKKFNLANAYYNLYREAVNIRPDLHKNLEMRLEDKNPLFKNKENEVTQDIIPESNEEYARLLYMNLVLNHDIIILPPLSEERAKDLEKIFLGYEDVTTFFIQKDSEKQLVLRFSLKSIIPVDVVESIAQSAEYNEEWATVKYTNLALLSHSASYHPISKYCLRIATACEKKGDITMAYQYYSLASILTVNQMEKEKSQAAISKIDNQNEQKLATPVILSAEELDKKYHFGIENYSSIIQNIITVMGNGKNLEEACNELLIDDEKKDIIYLLLARELYLRGCDLWGNKLLALVKEKNNSSTILDIINQINNGILYFFFVKLIFQFLLV